MQLDSRLTDEIAAQPYPLLFVTVSGAHLYGFPSPDSDYDLRGAHILPASEVLGLDPGQDSLSTTVMRDGLEIDLVSHDVHKYFSLVLRKNGYVLEQIFSPLIIHTTAAHEELRQIAQTCITRHHSHHYLGFAETQWRLFDKERPHRVKPLLYVFRVLLTGIYLMRTGEVEPNLLALNQEFRLPYIDALVAQELAGPEQSTLADRDIAFYQSEYLRLRDELTAAHSTSSLPETPGGKAALNDLLIRLRLGN